MRSRIVSLVRAVRAWLTRPVCVYHNWTFRYDGDWADMTLRCSKCGKLDHLTGYKLRTDR